jgi:hypothetical protein
MIDVNQTTPAPGEVDKSSAASANHAVASCMSAWEEAYNVEFAKRNDEDDAFDAAGNAYREAMPPLSGYENIRDFIACVVNAMLIGVIEDNKGSKLLYGAQVALTTVRRQPATLKLAE